MAYFIKAQGKIDLKTIKDLVLQTIDKLEFEGKRYRTMPFEPTLIESKEERDMYILGRILDPTNNYIGFDSVLAIHAKNNKAFHPNFFKMARNLDFFPNWVVLCGLETAHGFDIGPLHKNLSNERISEGVLLGRRIKENISGVENIVYTHYDIDNREIVPHFVKIS